MKIHKYVAAKSLNKITIDTAEVFWGKKGKVGHCKKRLMGKLHSDAIGDPVYAPQSP
jgi:hypothetical protein